MNSKIQAQSEQLIQEKKLTSSRSFWEMLTPGLSFFFFFLLTSEGWLQPESEVLL